ncbi:MAG: hypothetical protein RSB57_02855 [Hungatella sp.]
MHINFGISPGNMTSFHRINQSIAAKNGHRGSELLSKADRRDRAIISPQGQKNNLLEQLMKQKTNITDRKNALISSTLENGGTLDTIKSQLKSYDEQMKSVDEQIAELMTKEMEKQAEELKKQADSTPKTEEEIQNERLANITSLSSDLEQAKVIRSVQTGIDGDARVLKSEIALDKSRSGSSPAAAEFITKKEALLADMQHRSLDLASQISEKLSDVIEKADDINKPQETVPSEEEANPDGENSEQTSENQPD